MPRLSITKCCFCCNLKYGVYTFSILNLVLRFFNVLWGYLLINHLSENVHDLRHGYYMAIVLYSTPCTSWFFITSISLFFTLCGIVQKRHLLIVPHIVVQILEIVLSYVITIIIGIVGGIWYLFGIIFILSLLNSYYVMCLIYLFKQIKGDVKSKCYEVVRTA